MDGTQGCLTFMDIAVRHDVSRYKYSHSEMGSRLYPIANRGVQG